MKIAMFLFGVLFVCVVVDAEHPMVTTLNQGLRDCNLFLNPDPKILIMAEKSTHSDNRGANCIRACALNAIGFMKNNKLILANVLDVLNAAEGSNVEVVKEWTKILTYCKRIGEVSDDKCVVAGNYLKCLQAIINGSKDYAAEKINTENSNIAEGSHFTKE